MALRLKRIYDAPAADDGTRILIDRIWPRGISRDDAHLDHWLRDAAPSTELRKWFGHDPCRWKEFSKRYCRELDAVPGAVGDLRQAIGDGDATLLYAAKDTEHNNAVVLRDYLQQ